MQIMHSSIEYDMALSCPFTPGDDAYAVYLLLLYTIAVELAVRLYIETLL